MQINGTVSIEIDEVDIEQAGLEYPNPTVRFSAVPMVKAAYHHPKIAPLRRICDANDQTLEFSMANKDPITGKTTVTFLIREKTEEEKAW